MANPRGTSRNLERAMNGLSLTTNYNTGSASTADDYTTDNDGTDIMTPPDSGVDTSRFYHSSPDTRGGDQVSQEMNPRARFPKSRTWVSPDAKHMQDFIITRNAMRRLFKKSDLAKWKYTDFIAHREAMLASEKAHVERQVKAKEEENQRQLSLSHEQNEYTKILGRTVTSTLNIEGNRSLVLGEQTIWCVDWKNGKEEIAPWPTFAEMKWEGDDRAKTSVGRFLPLPREMGAPGIAWSLLQAVEQYEMDRVGRIPTLEDIYLPVDEIDDDVKYDLITKELEDAMDELLET